MSVISAIPPDVRPRAPRPVAKKPKPAARPLAPQTDAQQAQTQVAAAFDPVLQHIKDTFAQRATAQQGAINGYSKTLADLMGSYAPQAAQAYGGAVAGQSAVDASLAATREGQGAAAQAELAQRLAAIHADPSTAARIQGGFGSDLRGEALATAGRGGANLAMLLGQGAHAADYGAKLPGVAASMGLGATERAQGQVTTDLRTALGDLIAKRPDAYQTALSNISTTRQRQSQLDFEHALAQKKYGLDFAKANTSAAQTGTRLSIEQQNANTAATRAAAADKNAKRDFDLRAQSLGIEEKKLKAQLAAAERDKKTKGKLHGLSEEAYQTSKSSALGLARVAHSPTADGHPGVTWQQYLNGGLAKKVPMWILIEEGKRVYSPEEIKQGLVPGGK